MKIQLETITTNVNSSFNLLYNPRLSDLFFWHFHPEYELVYIEGATGTRHVGEHISTYEGNDLVLIGSNIPHLNFDYGVKTDYRKVVIHIKPAFIEKNIHDIPELASIPKLFEKAQYGIAFTGNVKKNIGKRLMNFEKLSPFKLFIEVLEIFQKLSKSKDFKLLHDQPYVNQYSQKEQQRLRNIYAFIDKNFHRKIELSEVAKLSNMTKEAFCRYFKKVTGNTFTEFLNQYRISQSKRVLMTGKTVSDACYSSGFESLSYFNRIFKKMTRENPSTFRKRYLKNTDK